MDINESKYEKKVCPRCDALFVCTGSPHCWCLEFDIPENLKIFLELSFEGCLCRNCLKELMDKYKK